MWTSGSGEEPTASRRPAAPSLTSHPAGRCDVHAPPRKKPGSSSGGVFPAVRTETQTGNGSSFLPPLFVLPVFLGLLPKKPPEMVGPSSTFEERPDSHLCLKWYMGIWGGGLD